MSPAVRSVGERLAAAARNIVGRDAERARLRSLIDDDAGPAVVFVHGPGGIGKTALVAATVDAVVVDGHHVEPTPAHLLEAIHAAGDIDDVEAFGDGRVLVIDGYERLAMVDDWLRNDLVPTLPASVTTVVVGRNPPNVAWRATPGWPELVADLLVGPLSDADAAALVARRGLRGAQAAAALRFGRGHPLALELSADAILRHPDLELAGGPPAEVIEQLIDVLFADLDESARQVVEAASVLRRVTEPGLHAVLDDDVDAAWRTVRDLPFTTVRPNGLELNGVVQEAVASRLELRAPGRTRELRRRAARTALAEAERSPGWDATADLLHLVQNPIVRNAFIPPPGLQHPVEAARPEDLDAILSLVARVDGDTSPIERWWELDPEAFRVLRGPRAEVRAFNVVRPADGVDDRLRRDDPLVGAFVADLSARPLPPRGRALFVRRALADTSGEDLSADLAPMIIDLKRTYLELRPELARVYTVKRDWSVQTDVMRAMGFVDLEEVASFTPCALDFGPGSVDGWLARHVEVETAREPEPSPAVSALSAREREVLVALSEGLSNRELADRLFISERTANRHLSNIFTKLGVHNRLSAARVAREAGLV
jgi:DNA-binding CsgD family transcriptional regulator